MLASSNSIALAGSPTHVKTKAYRWSMKLGLSAKARSNSAMTASCRRLRGKTDPS
jgi:hypothetical protein